MLKILLGTKDRNTLLKARDRNMRKLPLPKRFRFLLCAVSLTALTLVLACESDEKPARLGASGPATAAAGETPSRTLGSDREETPAPETRAAPAASFASVRGGRDHTCG